MILSDASIIREIEARNIVFDPPISEEDISPTSVDIHLGDKIYFFKRDHPAISKAIKLNHPDVATLLVDLLEVKDIPPDGYALKNQEFVLAYTKERVTLPAHIAARLEGRSTNARFGISIHSTAPTIHPTFSGNLALEICNFALIPCLLNKGMAIGQMIFEYVDSKPLKTLESAWQGQKPPT